MSQASPENRNPEATARCSTLVTWLRKCLEERRTATLLASAAIASMATTTLLPARMGLSAAQVVSDSYATSSTMGLQESNADMTNADMTSDDSGMVISPRGKDTAVQTVPFRPMVAPPVRRSPAPASSAPANSATAGQRGVLQAPVFGASRHGVPVNGAASTSAVGDTSGGHGSTMPALRAGHSGLAGGASNSRQGQEQGQGYNYVGASGVASLPQRGSSQRGSVSAAVPGTSGSTPGRSTRLAGLQDAANLQDGDSGALTVPNASDVDSKPSTPVPTVPSVNGSEAPVELPPGSKTAPVRSSTNAASASVPAPRGSGRGPAPGTSGFRATVESDAPNWIGPYMGRTGMLPAGVEQSPTPAPSVVVPENFSAWWDSLVQQRAGIAPRSISVDVTTLVQQALIYSSQVQVLQADPEVQHRIVKQEEATFDWRTFLNAKYDDLNDPIGNTLTTGNNDNRFEDRHTVSSGGLKRRTTAGGEVKLSQQFGYQENNSRFLLPNPQSTSRLELSFRQPLMSQSGVAYNQSQIVLARINASSSGDETLEELQRHLYGVAEAYWKLYRARAEFFQRQKLLSSAQKVLTTLEGRHGVDTIPRQILRARAAVARAESRMQRAVTDIRNAESQLRLLVNDPEMLNGGAVEFTPMEVPSMVPLPVGLRESLQEALVNRPDISRAIRQMRASGVRMGVSKSEMLPKLDFIVSSYVAGLENKAQFVDSFNNQFTQGRPGYTVGMEFEVPLGNRAAKAKVEQRQWELKRAINSFKATVETSLTEVEIASREVDTAWRELLGKYQAMVAAQNEVSYLQDRFDVLPNVEESSILLLEDLLDGYERLADEEAAFAQAQTSYSLSIIQLRRATGTMLRSRYDAPELENSETEWMTSRAEQTANEADARQMRVATLPGAEELALPTEAASNQLPVSWTQPVGERPKAVKRASQKPANHVGGHSFGNGF
jgi:outer membrane protein TolC